MKSTGVAHKEQEEAAAELEAYLNKTRPRNLAEGVSSGVSNILSGAVGAAGGIVLGPVIGAGAGYEKAGIVGAVGGAVGGLLVGAIGSVISATGGVLRGTGQIVRGVASVPQSIAAPLRGKWWNDIDGAWVSTDLEKEAESMKRLPEDDKDIIGDAADESFEFAADSFQNPEVKDPFYYEVLGVETDAGQPKIKRQYYILARQCHPDKVGVNSEAEEKFKNISEAYQVLADPQLRKLYDREGLGGLSADKTGVAIRQNQPDPTILFGFLFGSDKFLGYIGRLAVATSALVEKDLPLKEARRLQVRRCTRLALTLAEKLHPWVNDDPNIVQLWEAEALELSKASFGHELVVLIGQVYSLAAAQFLGSLDSGVGMPSITKWAKGKSAKRKKYGTTSQATVDTIKDGIKLAMTTQDAESAMAAAHTEEEKQAISEKLIKDQLSVMMQIMWTMTTVDVTSTIHESCQMVFFDKAVGDKAASKKRAKGVRKLGEIFMACPRVPSNNDPTKLYEDAAFAAMLETIKRKEESQFNASFRGFD